MRSARLSSLVGDLRQLASVRRITLDDGAERDVRALAFSTGGGLDFWVLSDRSFDIGPLWWRGKQLGWQSPGGFVSPALIDTDGQGGRGFERAFSGFLVTCGLDHIRQPNAASPMHGRLPFTPGRLTAYGEDWDRPEPVLFCEGEVTQARFGHETLRLRRRIEAPIGGSSLRIRDEVTNLGAQEWPQAMLYHVNLGYPAIRLSSRVEVNGELALGPLGMPGIGAGPDTRMVPVGDDIGANVKVVTPGDGRESLSLSLSFDTGTLPYLQFWQDLSARSSVLAIEPCTSERREDGQSGPEKPLGPGEKRDYALDIALSGDAAGWAP